MNHLPHFARFARALAVGATVGAATIAACSTSTTSDTSSGTTTTAASSGNENNTSASDAGAPIGDAEGPTASLNGSACATPGERRDDPSDSNSACLCGGSAGSSTWQCAQMPVPIAGPAAPPELDA